jgi:hypothetical protein
MDADALPTELDDCHRLIAALQSHVDKQASELQFQQTQLALKEKLVQEQAHSVLKLKENNDRLDEKTDARRKFRLAELPLSLVVNASTNLSKNGGRSLLR